MFWKFYVSNAMFWKFYVSNAMFWKFYVSNAMLSKFYVSNAMFWKFYVSNAMFWKFYVNNAMFWKFYVSNAMFWKFYVSNAMFWKFYVSNAMLSKFYVSNAMFWKFYVSNAMFWKFYVNNAMFWKFYAFPLLTNCRPASLQDDVHVSLSSESVCFQRPADIALVIDSTSSIKYEANFTLGLDFIEEFLNNFDISPTKTRVAAVMFGDQGYRHILLRCQRFVSFDTNTGDDTNNNSEIGNGSSILHYTNILLRYYSGIDYMVDSFLPHMRPDKNVAHLGIVLTDGQSDSPDLTKKAAERAAKAGITLIAIGIGKPVRNQVKYDNGELNMDQLEEIPRNKDFVLTVGNYSKLRSITSKLIAKYCTGERPVRNLKAHTNGVFDLDELNDIAGTNDNVHLENDFTKLKLIVDNLMDTFCLCKLERMFTIMGTRSRIVDLKTSVETLKQDLNEVRSQYKDCAQEAEVKTFKERIASYEEEMDEQKQQLLSCVKT
ncbi:hypothetical protein Btru_053861 [Bulinus truncatus]|nr:hypothetical protein Btru_053861 [Bulinus truncatus]